MKGFIVLMLIYILSRVLGNLEIWEFEGLGESKEDINARDIKQRISDLKRFLQVAGADPNNPNYHKCDEWRRELKELRKHQNRENND